MKLNKIHMTSILAAAAVIVIAAVSVSGKKLDNLNLFRTADAQVEDIKEVEEPVLTLEQRYPYEFPPRSTFYSQLLELEVPREIIFQMVQVIQPHQDLGRLKPGTRFQLFYSEAEVPEVTGIQIRFTPQEALKAQKIDGIWQAERIVKPVETKVVTFSGDVKSSLWESAVEAKMDPYLIAELAEIFAWQMDFAREVRVGDRWRLSVEQEFVQGEAVGWGSILAAEYDNAGRIYAAILFRNNNEKLGYFAPDGSSLRRMFLKTPIQYARISSRFQSNRFHPVLKTNRPHLGVDYAAPTGTPIRAIGDGVITMAGWNGGGGNTIKLRHNSIYDSAYKHLSRFAQGIKKGSRVKQGQTIGYVGSTGLSTGPHLHFEFFVRGKYVDPLKQQFPSAEPVPPRYLTQFNTDKASFLETLPQWEQGN
ncbi:M23 family metallopeptidase [Pseudobdellovibrio exovorus]|uniref:Uncharacterized protein n=1 Tax=Pseudobdellovibrio exovorus JSS TaxID=1184267 RepID=M4VQJ8_9BACT|nr:M23 family metallopeptidase [Pseudobdellovibrio exovorus]AGH95434.1 hypothetical protein A11Q_1218 [Pseudobdellovibrio exovorus JSS]